MYKISIFFCTLDFRTLCSTSIFILSYDTGDIHCIGQIGILHYDIGMFLCVMFTVFIFVGYKIGLHLIYIISFYDP